MAAFQTVGTKYKDCFREALVKAKMKMISEVKEKYKGKDDSPFIIAACNGNVEDVKILLSEDGMDINQKTDEDGYTALYYASLFGHIDIVNLLLQHKNVKINQQADHNGSTALHTASYNEHTEIVRTLLNHSDIDVNIKNNNGNTPLSYAWNEHTEIMELLKAKMILKRRN